MSELILHHYEVSPFARKVRAALGFKRLAFRSCEVAMQPPRAPLALLAGGYRRIPVLQVGADVFCDSNLIIAALDRIAPERPLRSPGDALTTPLSQWFEPRMFTIFSAMRFRAREDMVGAFASAEAKALFLRDRAAFMLPLLDVSKSAQNAPQCAAELRIFASYIEGLLSDGRDYLQGSAPTHADFCAFHPLHWLKGKSAHRDYLEDFPALWSWVSRIEAFGEGDPTSITSEAALQIARLATPAFQFRPSPSPADPAPGARVRVAPTDYGIDPAEGELVSTGVDHISIRRDSPELGRVHQHFPRWGYRIEVV